MPRGIVLEAMSFHEAAILGFWYLIRRCWYELGWWRVVKQRSICLDGPRCAVAQKRAHCRANPANMPKNLVIFIGPQLDGDSYTEAHFIVRIRHSISWHIASGPAANPVLQAGKYQGHPRKI
jgi:hypothetical protein